MIRFGTHLGAILAPFLLHFWSQIALGHSSLSKTWMFTKPFKNQRKINIVDPKTPWKSTQNRTKTTPRGDFFALRFAPPFLIDFCSVLAPKMPPFGHPFCSQNRSKKSSNIEVTQKSLQDHPISPQDGPRSPQEAPKRGPKSPKSTPRGPKIAPRSSKRLPREALKAQKHPKRFQKHQKESLRTL